MSPFYLTAGAWISPIFSTLPIVRTVGNVQALGANGKAAFSPKAHG